MLAWLQLHAPQDYLQQHRLLSSEAKVLKRNKADEMRRMIYEVIEAEEAAKRKAEEKSKNEMARREADERARREAKEL